MLSPLVLTLSGIIGTGVLFVLVASLVVFACIRSQRLRQGIMAHSLAPKKLDSMDNGHNGSSSLNGVLGGSCSNGSAMTADADVLEKKMNTLSSLEKNLVMKNTIMKMKAGSNQVLATVANGTEGGMVGTYVPNGGALPVYSEYEYNYAYPNSDLVIANGNAVINNNNHQQQHLMLNYGQYDNLAAYNGGHYDYAIHENLVTDESKVWLLSFVV